MPLRMHGTPRTKAKVLPDQGLGQGEAKALGAEVLLRAPQRPLERLGPLRQVANRPLRLLRLLCAVPVRGRGQQLGAR